MSEQLELIPSEWKPAEIIKESSNLLAHVVQEFSVLIRAELTNFELAQLHDTTERFKQSFDSFKKLARDRLEEKLLSGGEVVTEKGTLELDLGNGRVQRAIPTSTKPKDKLVEAMLKRKGLLRDVWMQKTIIYEASEEKLKELMDQKLITQADYNSCFAERSYRIGKSQVKGEENEED